MPPPPSTVRSRKSRAPRLSQVYPVPKSQPVDVVIPCSAVLARFPYYHCKSSPIFGVPVHARPRRPRLINWPLSNLCDSLVPIVHTFCASTEHSVVRCLTVPSISIVRGGTSLWHFQPAGFRGTKLLVRVEARRGRGLSSISTGMFQPGAWSTEASGCAVQVHRCNYFNAARMGSKARGERIRCIFRRNSRSPLRTVTGGICATPAT